MKCIKIICLLVMTYYLTSCVNKSTYSENKPKTAEELKTELKNQELNRALDYLKVKNVTLQPQKRKTRNAGLFHKAEYVDDGAMIEGQIVNNATIAKYKDVVVKVSFYSQTKTLIDEKSYVFYEYYEPHITKHFALKIDVLPQAYENFNFQVIGAKPADK